MDQEEHNLFSGFVDVELLQRLMESLYRSTGFPVGLVELYEGGFLISEGRAVICPNFHHVYPLLRDRCLGLNGMIGDMFTEEQKDIFSYQCSNGLREVAFGVRVDGVLRAVLIGGPYLYGEDLADTDRYRQQAGQAGCDLKEYLCDLSQVPVFSAEQVQSMVPLYSNLRDVIVQMAEKTAAAKQVAAGAPQGQNELRVDEEPHFQVLGSVSEAADQEGIDPERMEGRLRELYEDMEYSNSQLQISIERANLMAQEAMAANESKDQFLASVSHEIRTPLNAIVGFTDILGQESLVGRQQEYVGYIQKAVEELLHVMNDLLDFSKLEKNVMELKSRECDLRELFGYIEALVRPLAVKKGLSLEIIIPEFLPLEVQVDSLRLRQCVLSLLNNAIKFTETGSVRVRVRYEPWKQNALLHIEVEDTGIGIAAEKQKMIFESFRQGDEGTARKYGGVGLGLAMTKRLVDLFGGTILLKSEPGKGSVFKLAVPVGIVQEEVEPFRFEADSSEKEHSQTI